MYSQWVTQDVLRGLILNLNAALAMSVSHDVFNLYSNTEHETDLVLIKNSHISRHHGPTFVPVHHRIEQNRTE